MMAYGASKSAQMGFLKSLAIELAPKKNYYKCSIMLNIIT